MVGCVLDWVVLHTVKDGDVMPSGEQTETNHSIVHWLNYPCRVMVGAQPIFKKILDVGSYDVNGSFSDYNYFGRGESWLSQVGGQMTGIDLAAGKGVDKVMNAQQMTFKNNSFDLILCLEMLEHDDWPEKSIKEMYRVLKPGQPLILTCPDEMSPEHHQGVSDHYTFVTKDNLLGWLKEAGFCDIEYRTNHPAGGGHHLIYALKGINQWQKSA